MNAIETLNKIRQKYTCKGDIIFRTSLMNVVDCGQQSYNNEEWYNMALEEIDKRHDKAEAEGKWLIMTRDFEKTLLECSKEIAAVNTYELLKYIQKYAWIGGDFGELDYQEAIGLLKACMRNIEDSQYTTGDTLDVLYNIGFEDEQISYLGFDHLFEIEEE